MRVYTDFPCFLCLFPSAPLYPYFSPVNLLVLLFLDYRLTQESLNIFVIMLLLART